MLYAWRNEVAKKFGIEVVSELRKVTWPSWKEIKGATLIVLGVTFAVSFVLFIFDKIYDGIVGFIFRLA